MTEHIAEIYQRLPPNARHEALDFMLFLRAGYASGSVEGQSAQAATILKEVVSSGRRCRADAVRKLQGRYRSRLG
jgi:hypothetical protein